MAADDLSPGMTFEEIILDCAERWGHADETGDTAGIPTDDYLLDKIKRKVNAGYRAFLTANPKWTFLEERVQIQCYPDGDGPYNIDGDAGRYRLPSRIASSPRFDWTFEGDQKPGSVVMNLAHDIVLRRRAAGERTGIPEYCGVGPIDPDAPPGGAERGWEAVFYPAPAADYLLETTFRVDSHTLIDLSERHIAGRSHDRTLIAFCDWEWYRDDGEDETVRERYKAEIYGDGARPGLLALSIAADNERRSRRHGNLGRRTVRVNTGSNLGRVTLDGSAVV
jgi:hypothetical protein